MWCVKQKRSRGVQHLPLLLPHPPRGVNFALFGLSAPGWGQAARRPLMAPRRARAGPQGLCEGAPSRLGPGGVAELQDKTSPALPQAAPALPAFWES